MVLKDDLPREYQLFLRFFYGAWNVFDWCVYRDKSVCS